MHRLNLFGLDFIDPIVLAPLADERPLLQTFGHSADWISRVCSRCRDSGSARARRMR